MRLAFLKAIGLAVATSFDAHAQHCRPASDDSALGGIDVHLRAEAATYRTARFEGSYEGLFLGGGFRGSRAGVRVQLPRYRIVRNGRPQQGFGDLLADTQLRLYQLPEPALRVGVAFAMTAPTGSQRADLGMGHFMATPSVWADLTGSRFMLQAKLLYAGVLGSREGHRQHSPGSSPIVAPMNASELGTLLTGSLRVYDVVRARLGAFTALPLSQNGASRGAALFATDFVFPRLRFTVEAECAFIGDPFLVKLASEAGVRF